MKYIIFLLLLLLLDSCARTRPGEYGMAEQYIVDSFGVSGIGDIQEFNFLSPMNDSMLYSFDSWTNTALLYKRKGSRYSRFYSKELQAYSNTGISALQYNSSNDHFYYIDGIDKAFEVLDNRFNTLYRKTLHRSPLALPYRFNSVKENPVTFISEDTLLIHMDCDSGELFEDFLEAGHPVAKVVLGEDSVRFIDMIFTYPATMKNYFKSWSFYLRNGNKIVMLYNYFDTLYTYDLVSHKEEKIPVGNRDFKPLPPFDASRIMDRGYNRRYDILNFRYGGLHYNPVSRHYLLFYKKPGQPRKDGLLPKLEDEPLRVLVMDTAFRKLKYLVFDKSYFGAPCYMYMPGKGLAIPLFSKNYAHDPYIKFYIFNL